LLFCFKTSSNTKLTFYVSLWIWITNYVFLIVYIFIIPLELYMPGSTIKLMHLLKVGISSSSILYLSFNLHSVNIWSKYLWVIYFTH
jgi:hypothetical protein